MVEGGLSSDVLQYLALSLSPVFIIGIGILAIKISRNKNKSHDESSDNQL